PEGDQRGCPTSWPTRGRGLLQQFLNLDFPARPSLQRSQNSNPIHAMSPLLLRFRSLRKVTVEAADTTVSSMAIEGALRFLQFGAFVPILILVILKLVSWPAE